MQFGIFSRKDAMSIKSTLTLTGERTDDLPQTKTMSCHICHAGPICDSSSKEAPGQIPRLTCRTRANARGRDRSNIKPTPLSSRRSGEEKKKKDDHPHLTVFSIAKHGQPSAESDPISEF
jgi:hypothetical protein